MPTPRHRYTLVGFSDELDWRELNFVEPLPSSRICQACGLVTRVTGLLPCRHIFCKKCYEQSRRDDAHCCPLDGQLVLADDVEWMECPVHNLLKRKVKCWNEDRGCDTLLSASELNKHFCKDCDHHSTSCPRCSMVVRCNNVCAHMQSECRDHVMSVASGNPPTDTTGEKALMMALTANIDTRADEMKERLDHLAQLQCNRLNEISHCMNAVKETLLEISSRTRTLGSVASSSEAMRETLNDHGEKLQQLAGTISNSHETLKDAVESTKLSLQQKNEDTANILKADLAQHFSDQRGALKETLQNELKEALNDHGEKLQQIAGTVSSSHETLKDAVESTRLSLEQKNEDAANMLKADLTHHLSAESGALRKTLQEELQDASMRICSDCAETVSRIVEVKNGEKQANSAASNCEKVLALIRINVRRHEFVVEGFKAMKESALSMGYCDYEKEKTYISGYRMSPGVYFRKEGTHVYVHPHFQLHKGMIDDVLQWPFKQKVRLIIKHPSLKKECRKEEVPPDGFKNFTRPVDGSNAAICFSNCSFRSDDLEREGYVTDDKLRVVLELI